tara:strand:- start:1106 stop:1603 length:498 start_codon:yes stop_codon:yes gene_type:complete
MNLYVGIDPGLLGAIAVLDDEGRLLDAVRTPVIPSSGKGGKTEYDIPAMAQFLEHISPDLRLITLEQVNAMPHDGVTSAFRFGMGYGIWRGIASALRTPMMLARPVAWQAKALAGRPRGKAVKSSAVAAAKDLWPNIPIKYKRDWGMADAALIAEHGRRQHRSKL